MAIDEPIAQAERRFAGDVRTVVLGTYQQQSRGVKLIILLAVIIIIAIALWFVGSAVIGFMGTPAGFLLIGITIVAIIMYLWMRSQGIGFQSWTGGIIEVLLIVMLLVVYVGALDVITSTFLAIFPFLLLGGVAWIGYKWWKTETRDNVKFGILAMVIAFCVVFPISQAFIVPYILGQPMELEVYVSRSDTGAWDVYGEIHPLSFSQTMSTQLNPYAVGVVESSNWMWNTLGTTEKAYVDITITDDESREVVYSEVRHTVYVGHDDSEKIWGFFHLPPEDIRHYVPYKLLLQVKDSAGITLASWSYIYTTD